MLTTIGIKCTRCQNSGITGNGKKSKGKQNYLRKDCGRQFINGRERTYNGPLSRVKSMIKIMPVRGVGIRDIVIILEISVTAVLKALTSMKYEIKPKQSRYDRLGTGEFWTYVGKRRTKYGLSTRITVKAGRLRRLYGGNGTWKPPKN
jgi:transposase-like protein